SSATLGVALCAPAPQNDAGTVPQVMNIHRATLILVASIVTASCSEKSGQDRNQNLETKESAKPSPVERSVGPDSKSASAEEENEFQPAEDEIAEDCVAFLRSTKTVPAHGATADCPQCPAAAEATEVLKFDDIKVDRVTRSESTCEVNVTIRATFNPSARENITGGLSAWITPEQRAKYLQGEIPA